MKMIQFQIGPAVVVVPVNYIACGTVQIVRLFQDTIQIKMSFGQIFKINKALLTVLPGASLVHYSLALFYN